MRVAIALVIGLLAGSIGSIMAYKSLSAGNEVPRAVMWMMRYHFGAVGDAIQSGECEATAMTAHIDTLSRVADDIEPVFLPVGEDLDAQFTAHTEGLRKGIRGMHSAASAGCEALATAREETFEACKACHRDFR